MRTPLRGSVRSASRYRCQPALWPPTLSQVQTWDTEHRPRRYWR